MMKYSIDTQIN